MERILIISTDAALTDNLRREITHGGYDCASVTGDDYLKAINRQALRLIIIDISRRFDTGVMELIANIKKRKELPVIALVASEDLAGIDDFDEIDDFIIYPYDETELLMRLKRLLQKNKKSDNDEKIQRNGLTIDLVTCEVTVDGKKADLTYKEYELLKLMAGSPGRVFTREALLDKIWGYDYFGGDRTVDVHMRRLRSKIEDANHTYIETVRNIGYRFTKGS
ncbi:MAG: response regulator transcription factor [Dehalococcoidales bacterium]|nr:response regulator transcription factor [Dehalococcoidales bacterium]